MERTPNMRIASVIFVGSVAVLMMAAPAFAKHPEAKTDEDTSTASSCHAYQQAADGSWQQLPCREFGNGQTQHKSVAKGGEEEPR
jgi:hypothetical protein